MKLGSYNSARLGFTRLSNRKAGFTRLSNRKAGFTRLSNRKAGFTLIELLLSVSIIGIITATTIPVYNTFVTRNDLDIATQDIANTFRRAQSFSRGMESDSAWSVEIQTAAVTLFRGTNFGSRNTAYDEVVTLPAAITVTAGTGQVQFAKLTATPNTTASVTLTSNSNETRTVTVNGRGMVNY